MEKEVFVQLNRRASNGADSKVILVRPGDNMVKLKKLAGKALGIRVRKVFLPSGAEIESVDEVQNHDVLLVSSGEPFHRVTTAQDVIKISVLGTGGVGKSAITLRYVRDRFVEDWDPTIEDAYRKTVDVDGTICTLEILDTAGQDDFESLRPQWMIGKDGYLFVYSMDSQRSLKELEPFVELHRELNEQQRVPIVLVANKKDLRHEVSEEEGRQYAADIGALYVETSALTSEGVAEAFKDIVREVRQKGRAANGGNADGGGKKSSSGWFSWCSIL